MSKDPRKVTMVSLTCVKCGANLDVDIDHLQAYCPFCGTKLLIDVGQMTDILEKKEVTKQKMIKYERDLVLADSLLNHRERAEIQRNKEKNQAAVIGIIIFVMLFLVCFLMMRYFG